MYDKYENLWIGMNTGAIYKVDDFSYNINRLDVGPRVDYVSDIFNDNNDKIRESVPEPVVNEYFDPTFFAKIFSNLFTVLEKIKLFFFISILIFFKISL